MPRPNIGLQRTARLRLAAAEAGSLGRRSVGKIARLSILLLLFSKAASAGDFTAASAERMVGKLGPRAAVEAIFASESDSQALLKGVATGAGAWLRVAVDLRPGLDAHPAESLRYALGSALRAAPDGVLQVALPAYSIRDICGGPDVDDYEHLAPALAELHAREKAVRRIKSTALAGRRDECLAALASAEKPLRAFFVRP